MAVVRLAAQDLAVARVEPPAMELGRAESQTECRLVELVL
jgi:hypothetical protein